MDGEIASEDKVSTIFDLLQGEVRTEIDGGPVFLGKLRPYHPGPRFQLLSNDSGAEAVGGGL
jgi:hypothetical protein